MSWVQFKRETLHKKFHLTIFMQNKYSCHLKKRSTGICLLMSWVQFQREILHKNVHVMSTTNKKKYNDT